MVEIKGISKLLRRIEAVKNKAPEQVMSALAETAIIAVTEMQLNTPVITSRLRSSMHYETSKTQAFVYNSKEGQFDGKFGINIDDMGVAFGSNVEYAGDANYGTRPHIIEPKEKQALYWKGAKHPVKRVNHPGTQGLGFFQKGIAKAKDHLPKALKRHFKL